MGVNKVDLSTGETLIDISNDTVTPETLAEGATAHNAQGEPIMGTMTAGVDTSDATATAANILETKTAYVNGEKVTGTMPNKGTLTVTFNELADDDFDLPEGYYRGGYVMRDGQIYNRLRMI